MAKKAKSGAGKFFLGAILGAAAGAIASKFTTERAGAKKSCSCKNCSGCGKTKTTKKAEPKSKKSK